MIEEPGMLKGRLCIRFLPDPSDLFIAHKLLRRFEAKAQPCPSRCHCCLLLSTSRLLDVRLLCGSDALQWNKAECAQSIIHYLRRGAHNPGAEGLDALVLLLDDGRRMLIEI